MISKEQWTEKRTSKKHGDRFSYKEKFYETFDKKIYKKIVPKLAELFKALNNGKPASTVIKDFSPPPELSHTDTLLINILRDFGYECTLELYSLGIVRKEGKEISIFEILNSRIKKIRGLDKLKEQYKKNKIPELKKQIEFYENLLKAGLVTENMEIDLSKLSIAKNKDFPKLVFSYNHRAVASQSTKTGWDSCMTLGEGTHHEFVGSGASAGVFVCYFIRASDKDPIAMNHPTARILFKPYIGSQTGHVIWEYDSIYGEAPRSFQSYAQSLIDNIIKMKEDIYYLPKEVYIDEVPRRIDTLKWEELDDKDILNIALSPKHNPFVKIKAVRQLKDPEFLTRIALNTNENEDVRAEAVKKITDQKVLEKIVKKDVYPSVRVTALSQITDVNFLNEIVNSESYSDRLVQEAVKRATDTKGIDKIVWDRLSFEDTKIEAVNRLGQLKETKLLERIAKNYQENDLVRDAALPFIHDQKELAEIAFKRKSSKVLMKITDQKELEDILDKELKDPNANIFFIRDIFGYIENEDILTKIGLDEKVDPRIRKYALTSMRIPSQDIFSKLATDKSDSIRELAIEKLTDQDLLKKVVLKDENSGFRERALERIEKPDYNLLKKIVLEDESIGMQLNALKRLRSQSLLTEKDQDWFCAYLLKMAPAKSLLSPSPPLPRKFQDTFIGITRDIVTNPKLIYKLLGTDIGWEVVRDIEDESLLAKIAQDEKLEWEIRKEAVSQIKSEKILKKIIENGTDEVLIAIANRNLKDQEYFAKIALEHKDWKVRTAAVKRISPFQKDILKQIAENDPDEHVKQTASDKLEELKL
jgi:hypothetical protein